MRRSNETELLDADDVNEATLRRAYRELWLVNRVLGNVSAVLRLLRQGQTGSVLDIGCGQGALLIEIQRRTGATVMGVDMREAPADAPVPIVTADAVNDPLPQADVAVCVLMAHHLTEDDVVDLIRNVARSCKRLILLDLVRHRVPLVLFSIFLAPFLSGINAADGKTSIRKAFTGREMQALVDEALSGTGRQVMRKRHKVAPFWIRQVIDIHWAAAPAGWAEAAFAARGTTDSSLHSG